MFQDPVVAVMAMMMLSFLGLIIMFIFVIRSQASLAEETRESFRRQQMFLADLERQLLEVNFALRGLSPSQDARPQEEVPDEERELPILRRKDSLLTMLEHAAVGREESLNSEQKNLLPAPNASRPLSEDYDPSTDPHLFEDSLLSDFDKDPVPDDRSGNGNTNSDRMRIVSSGGQRQPFSLIVDN